MSEETLLSIEGAQDRATIAAYFRQFADGLEADGAVTFSTDTDEVELTVPERSEFEIEIEAETEDDETEYEIEFEIEWSTADHDAEQAAGGLEIGTEADDEQETITETIDEAEADEPAGVEPTADDEAQTDHAEREAGGDVEMEQIDPPHGQTEDETAEDDK